MRNYGTAGKMLLKHDINQGKEYNTLFIHTSCAVEKPAAMRADAAKSFIVTSELSVCATSFSFYMSISNPISQPLPSPMSN